MTSTMKTQWIAGHKITLEEGVRHLASRPMLSTKHTAKRRCTVSIFDEVGGTISPIPVHQVRGLSYDEANRLLSEFNNGATSFEGRVW